MHILDIITYFLILFLITKLLRDESEGEIVALYLLIGMFTIIYVILFAEFAVGFDIVDIFTYSTWEKYIKW